MSFSRFKTLISLRTSPHKTQHFLDSPFISLTRLAMRSITSRPLLPLHRFSSTPSPLRNGEESKAVKITVWWDIENCSIPTGVNPYRVANRITSALRYHGIKGPITITAYGNMFQLKEATHDALCTTGVGLNHVPNCGKKNSTDRFILGDLVYWVAQNSPPAHFFLISGDRDFASILHRLRMSNYNILLASGSSNGSTALYNAATIMWNWDVLVRGDSLTGRHFNHPPDGLYGSWYGHYMASIEDIPLDSDESIRSLQPLSEESGKLSVDSTHSIPKTLVRNISQILTSNPNGISNNALPVELKKRQIPLDKDYYGHKKLSSLVSSLSNIAMVKPHPYFEYDLIAYNAYDRSKELDHPSSMSALDDVVDHEEKQLTGKEDAMLAIQPSQSTVKMKAEISKKWHADSDSKPKVPEKKAKLITPSGKKGTNVGKKNSYPVTPCPMKKPCKTVAKPQTLKPAGTAVCKSCSKIFISQSALQSHSKAKHVGTTACKLRSNFISESDLQFHTKAKHVGTNACKSCSKSFISESALRSHTKAKHA